MTQNVQVSAKLNDGTILVIGGESVREFRDNAGELLGRSGAEEVEALFMKLVPVDGGMGRAEQNVRQSFPQSQRDDYQPRQGAGSPPGGDKLCPSHGQPAMFKSGNKNGKDWSFWKCPVTDQIITDFSGNFKTNCG